MAVALGRARDHEDVLLRLGMRALIYSSHVRNAAGTHQTLQFLGPFLVDYSKQGSTVGNVGLVWRHALLLQRVV